MSQNNDFHIKLTPCQSSDSARFRQQKLHSLPEMKVSYGSRLTSVSAFLLNEIPPGLPKPSEIILYIKRGNDRIVVPQCLTIGELFFMTNQGQKGEIFYSVIDEPEGEMT
jgi:hypothetical protein